MKSYEQMSDFEANRAVAARVTSDHFELVRDEHVDDVVVLVGSRGQAVKHVDYCNNPSDAWPVIESNKITIEFGNCDPDGRTIVPVASAHSVDNKGGMAFFHRHQSGRILRAAMIVFLMMGDE